MKTSEKEWCEHCQAITPTTVRDQHNAGWPRKRAPRYERLCSQCLTRRPAYEPRVRDVVAWKKNPADEYEVINYDGRRKKPWLIRNVHAHEVWVTADELVFRRRPL